jgi:hypothetical protein
MHRVGAPPARNKLGGPFEAEGGRSMHALSLRRVCLSGHARDALRLSAVKYGVGRYLYRLPSQWVERTSPTRRCATRSR